MTEVAAPGDLPDADHGGDAVHGRTGHGRLRDDRWSQAFLVVLTIPFLVGAVAARRTDWWPASDLSLLDLRIADVGTGDTPLLGPFSRFGWSHPGPLLTWLLAPAYRLLGATSSAGPAAAALQNAVVVVATGVLAHRLGGRRLLALLSLCTALLLAALGGEVLVSTWNPWISLLPFVALLLLAWGLADGDVVLLPWAVLVGSYLVQSHVGYVALVGALGAWAVGALAWQLARARRTDADGWPARRRRVLRVGLVALVVAAAAWIGPAVDQLTEEPGNVRAIASYFSSSAETPIGVGESVSVASRQLSPVAPWLGGSEHLDFLARLGRTSPLWALPLLLAFGATAVLAWRRGDGSTLRLHATVAVGLVTGVAAVSRITDQPYYYLFRWWWVLAMWTWLTVAWSALQGLAPDAASRTWRVLVPICLAGTVVGAGLATTSTADPLPSGTHEEAVAQLAPQVLDRVDAGGTYAVRPLGFSWFEVYFGVLDQLERHDVAVRVDEPFRSHAGSGRVLDPDDPPDGVLYVATGTAVEDALDDPRLTLVAAHDPLSPDERAELEQLQREQRQVLLDAGLDDLVDAVENEGIEILAATQPALDPQAAQRIAALLRRGQVVAVFEAPWPAPDLTVPAGGPATGAPPPGGG